MITLFVTIIYFIQVLIPGGEHTPWGTAVGIVTGTIDYIASNPTLWIYAVIFPLLFVFNFLILMGPLMLMGITQIRGFEPGDADWGVKLEDVRGQAEAKEEVRKIVSLWQSGEAFEQAGGKRERGMLFLGAPGTGKTMLGEGDRDRLQLPVRHDPRLGLPQTFMGMDAIIVRYLAWKAKRLARKWGGQCIVFIDEIDAVGMRRAALGRGRRLRRHRCRPPASRSSASTGPHGALNPSGDLILETARVARAAVRERERAAPRGRRRSSATDRQPGPHARRRWAAWASWRSTSCSSSWTGSATRRSCSRSGRTASTPSSTRTYVVPRRIGRFSLRLPPPRPRNEQIYFIGATNVPIEIARPGAHAPGPAWAATSGSGRRRSRTAWTSSTSTSTRSRTSPTSTTPQRATSSRASPTGTRPR